MESRASYPTNLSCRKVYAFLEEGILAKETDRDTIVRKYGFPITGSSDEEKVNRVCVNYINNISNIGPSLYKAANGGFAVVTEERKMAEEKDKGITQLFLEDNEALIQAEAMRLREEFPFRISLETFLPKAASNIIEKSSDFKTLIARKVNRTALFILNIPMRSTVEGHIYENIPAENIEKVFLPEHMKDEIEKERGFFEKYADKINYVSSDRIFSFKYGYTISKGNVRTLEIENIIGPDYEKILKAEIGKATHMTSLFPEEDFPVEEY